MSETFDKFLERQQVKWRDAHVSTRELGTHAGHRRQWILPSSPKDAWEEGLWPGIRSGRANSVQDYLDANKVQRHTGANNLKSSWVLCANLYFPFRETVEGKALLAGFLHDHVAREVESVHAVELEFASEDETLSPENLLGEAGGSRGSGQTSPDVAFIVNGGSGIVLTEIKFAEHSFYECSARTRKSTDRRPGNLDPSRCKNALAVLANPASQCHQVVWGRRYFEQLAPVADRAAWSELTCCPAARAGYQLFRQQALAEAMANSDKYDLVVSCVAMDERNETLANSLASTGIACIADWGRLFHGRARFAMFTHQKWFEWVRAHGPGEWAAWVSWIGERYGFGSDKGRDA